MTGAVVPSMQAVAELPPVAPPGEELQGGERDAGPEGECVVAAEAQKDWELSPKDKAGLPTSLVERPGDWGADRDLWMYRDRTVALLRRYARLAVETGRLPSLLGRDFFRAKITSYHVATFEDTVIFVHDVERSLERLGWFEKKLIAMVVLEEFSQEEAARLLQCSPRTVGRLIYEALDQLSEIFLRGSILKPMVAPVPNRETACQGGKSGPFPASDGNQGKNNS